MHTTHFTNILSSKHPVKEYILGRQIKWLYFPTCLQKLWLKWVEPLPDSYLSCISHSSYCEWILSMFAWLAVTGILRSCHTDKVLLTFASAVLLPSLLWPAALCHRLAAGMLCCCGCHMLYHNWRNQTAFILPFPDRPQLSRNFTPP